MRIRVLPGGAEGRARTRGAVLLEAAREAGLELPFGCQVARCGICLVEVVEGAGGLEPPTAVEEAALAGMGVPAGLRLACQARVRGPVTVRPFRRPFPGGNGAASD